MEESYISKGMILTEYHKSNEYALDRVDRTREIISKLQFNYDLTNAHPVKSIQAKMDLEYFSGKILMYNRLLEKWVNHIALKP